MRILVTGGTGFVGRRIVEYIKHLNEPQLSPVSLCYCARRPPDTNDPISSDTEFFAADLSKPQDCWKVVSGCDAIIHCAGRVGVWGSYHEYYAANVTVTDNLIQAAKGAGVKRFINISSPSIYLEFRDQLNVPESFVPKHFSNAYAKTKWQADKLVHAAHGETFQTVSLRPRWVIGAGDNNVLPLMIKLQKKGALPLIGNGQNLVDVTTIQNLLEVIKTCLTAPSSVMGCAYNISNGAPITLQSFLDQVMAATGLPPATRLRQPYWAAMLVARLNEWRGRVLGLKEAPSPLPISVRMAGLSITLDISQARERLGYMPKFTTQQGIEEFANWWKTHEGSDVLAT